MPGLVTKANGFVQQLVCYEVELDISTEFHHIFSGAQHPLSVLQNDRPPTS